MTKPSSLRPMFISKGCEVLSVGRTLKSLHSTVCRVDDVVLKMRSFDVKSAKEVKERLKDVARSFDFLPDFLGVVVGAVEVGGEVRPAVVSVHSYAEPISILTLKDVWEMLAIIVQAQAKSYALDIKPSNFGRLRGRIVYLDEYGIGKPFPKDILEDLEEFKRKIERYFKQVSAILSEKGLKKADARTRGLERNPC